MVYEGEFIGYLPLPPVDPSCLRLNSVWLIRGVCRDARCLPYPPPGYEPRPRSQHKDPLKKERHKGKKHGREKGEGKGKERRKDKDRDHKKLKREKRRERRKNKDRNKDNNTYPEQETQKSGDFNNRRPKERRKHATVKDVKCLDELVAKFPGQRSHPNHKVNSSIELIPGPVSSKGFGATASKQNERSVGRSVEKSAYATQDHHGMIQKNDSHAHAKKKESAAGVSCQTRKKNGKKLQVGLAEKRSSRRHSSKVKQMKRSGDVNERNNVDDLRHLACLDEQKSTCDDIKKRKELDDINTLHENGVKTTKLPRMSPTNISCLNGNTSLHSQGIAPYSSAELAGTNSQEVDWHKPQDGYSNGITGSRYLEQQKDSVSCVYDSNEAYLKPPHPYTKYLSQVSSVSPREDISECIDEDWLFSEDCVERNRAAVEPAGSHQVWSDAQLIDTADVVALPYVVLL